MKANKSQSKSISIFEKLKKTDKSGNEYWSAMGLAKLLGYSKYSSFIQVLDKAKAACINTGQDTVLHFKGFSATIKSVGNDLQRNRGDVKLSRYGCYLVIQNADPALKPVALGQAYFAIQARLQELNQQQKSKNFKMVRNRRNFLRKELAKRNLQLAGAARKAGIVKPADYAFFQNHGYRGLYGGLDVKAIRKIRGLDSDENILDHMDSTELAVNLFRVTQTAEKLNDENVQDRVEANRIHFAVGLKARKVIEETIGISPENFPVATTIKLANNKDKELKTRKSSKNKTVL
ncbi:DNA damage-inducible protein D [Flavobacterium sp. 2]|uniref:DNA damage-inducible protein D n=1 Tax=Flavobacterium sp. 2 TaxID=308053 RepID=UPI000C19416E|nr:DNA damage-inducible protein D [Flavobacterium sp. 2]PIF71336.1 DNA-damage-inducible protein D [Flavobacterium sp. 2]